MARFSNPFTQYLSDSGRIIPGAKLYFYVNGTTTPQTTYADAAFTVANPNPVICGSNGRVPDIYMPGNLVYSITLTDTNDVQIDQADDITGTDSRVSSSDVIAALAANSDPVVINGSSAAINADTTIDGVFTTTGDMNLPNDSDLNGRNSGDSAYIPLIKANTSDEVEIDPDGNGALFKGSIRSDEALQSWTPVVSDAASGGNLATGTFNGTYVRVGKEVTIVCSLTNIVTTGMTGANALYIQNIPFDAASLSGTQFFNTTAVTNFLNFSGSGSIAAFLQDGNSAVTFGERVTGANVSTTIVSNVVSGSCDIYFTLKYFTDDP